MSRKTNAAIVALTVGVAAIAAGVTVLAIRGGRTSPAIDSTVTGYDAETRYTEVYETQTAPLTIAQIAERTSALIVQTAAPATTKQAPATTRKQAVTTTGKQTPATTTQKATQPAESTTINPQVLEDTESGKTSVSQVTKTDNSSLPNDMSLTGLYRSKYDVIGLKKYIYNNDTDPNCRQRKYGYNPLYDAGAKLIDFSIETCRLKFNYDSKDYLIQIWKGQYISGDIGTVGGEVGIYTRPQGKVSTLDHYNCADESDWLYMEMTVLWDENGDGNYTAQLTRPYELHWWETGYVDGQLPNKRDSSPLRILSHITFKDTTQAQAFENALTKQGFTAVATFNPTVKDTCKRYGKDVIFVWQDVR
ncbi:MAG: DUF4474 domain-containing protein [Clostridia bacterium]|nr:DUF4474 domain-containing protein [Clostridia bacterium]